MNGTGMQWLDTFTFACILLWIALFVTAVIIFLVLNDWLDRRDQN